MPAEPRAAAVVARGDVARVLAAEFPGAWFAATTDGLPCVTIADLGDDPSAFDPLLHDAEGRGSFTLVLDGDVDAAREVLLRYQRYVPWRNPEASDTWFAAVLRRHREVHDLSKPLVRADFDHTRDTWQWLLRLEPNADPGLQIAALFHDVERLESEADVRIEQHASDYDGFKQAHARRGAEMLTEILGGLVETERPAALIARHERPTDDEGQLLADADALSFFALNSPGYLAYYGPEQTRKKVVWTLSRMSDRARRWLAVVRLMPEVRLLADGG